MRRKRAGKPSASSPDRRPRGSCGASTRSSGSPFLNHHRACLFAIEVEAANGHRRRKYPQELIMAAYEKLRSLPGADGFLKPGITFEQLDSAVHTATDLAAALQS